MKHVHYLAIVLALSLSAARSTGAEETSLVRKTDVPWILGGSAVLGIGFALDTAVQDRMSRDATGDENVSLQKFGNVMQYFGLYSATGLYLDSYLREDPKSRESANRLVESFAWTLAVVYPIKYAFGRQRPHDTDDRFESDPGKHLSFPSGHTSVAFAAATTLSLQYPTWEVVVPAYALAGTVGLSRLMANQHWLSDVLAGAMIGSGVSVVVDRWHKRKSSRESAWYLIPSLDGLTLVRRF